MCPFQPGPVKCEERVKMPLVQGLCAPVGEERRFILHSENDESSPPSGGCPAPHRGRWWGWCCFHCQLQPMPGTWRHQRPNRDMGLSSSKWDTKTQKPSWLNIQKPPDTETLRIVSASSRWAGVAGNRLRASLCVAKKRKSGSFRRALSGDAAKTDARDACGGVGNDKGGSQLLSL